MVTKKGASSVRSSTMALASLWEKHNPNPLHIERTRDICPSQNHNLHSDAVREEEATRYFNYAKPIARLRFNGQARFL